MYPAPAVTALIDAQFVPVRQHVKQQPQAWHRFAIRWTPTVLVLSPEGKEIRRIEGFLPEDEFIGQLELALGHLATTKKDWRTAERWFETASGREHTDAGPEGQYWAGVARYSGSHAHEELAELRRRFEGRYAGTSWAKRASVW